MDITSSHNPGVTFLHQIGKLRIQRSVVYAIIILTALLSFEIFNYSTTDYALTDLLGNLRFAGVRWATLLSFAFCGIDFAGVARLFTPEKENREVAEIWYLFAAWMLAAAMNATLTWWGVSMAIVSHQVQSSAVIGQQTLFKVVPIFVAVMVWLIRILIIGSLSIMGDRLLAGVNRRVQAAAPRARVVETMPQSSSRVVTRPVGASAVTRPAASFNAGYSRPEPTYHNMSARARQAAENNNNSQELR
jgi:hypothetical protein